MKLKDKKIELVAFNSIINENGYPVTVETTIARVWAYFRQLSGSEFFAASAVQMKEEVLFQINYRDDVNTSCCVRYNGALYDITRVDVFEGYRADLTLYCKRR
mgnify:FL=1